MAKDTFYFSHDYNARTDEKVKLLIRKHGMEGYGIYWSIIEDLYNNANALRTDCEGIAFDLRVDEKVVKSIIEDFDLFVIEGEEFGSMSVQRRLDERDAKSRKARDSAKKRWNNDANAMRTHSERNAIKERKEKEKKEKEIETKKQIRDRYYVFINEFNKITGSKAKGSDNDLNNFTFWLKTYSPSEIVQAVKNHDDTFWAKKINPQWLFRTKDTKGQPVDYIGQLLDHKKAKTIL